MSAHWHLKLILSSQLWAQHKANLINYTVIRKASQPDAVELGTPTALSCVFLLHVASHKNAKEQFWSRGPFELQIHFNSSRRYIRNCQTATRTHSIHHLFSIRSGESSRCEGLRRPRTHINQQWDQFAAVFPSRIHAVLEIMWLAEHYCILPRDVHHEPCFSLTDRFSERSSFLWLYTGWKKTIDWKILPASHC